MIVLDSGGISKLADRSLDSLALLKQLSTLNDVMLVPTPVLVECLHGNSPKDAPIFRFLQKCVLQEVLPLGTAQRAAELRRKSGHGSAVDAIVVAFAEPGGTVITGDRVDIENLATHANKVYVVPFEAVLYAARRGATMPAMAANCKPAATTVKA